MVFSLCHLVGAVPAAPSEPRAQAQRRGAWFLSQQPPYRENDLPGHCFFCGASDHEVEECEAYASLSQEPGSSSSSSSGGALAARPFCGQCGARVSATPFCTATGLRHPGVMACESRVTILATLPWRCIARE